MTLVINFPEWAFWAVTGLWSASIVVGVWGVVERRRLRRAIDRNEAT